MLREDRPVVFGLCFVAGAILLSSTLHLHISLDDEALASWVEAVGTVAAVIVAIFLWRGDRKHKQSDDIRQDKAAMTRLVVGLRAEIDAAVDAAATQQEVIEKTLKEIHGARLIGKNPDMEPIPADALKMTDRIMYAAMAADIGRLPPELLHYVVTFYAMLSQVERLALASKSPETTLEVVVSLIPRLRMWGSMSAMTLKKFEEADYDSAASVKLTSDEILALAKEVGYDIQTAASERGLKI